MSDNSKLRVILRICLPAILLAGCSLLESQQTEATNDVVRAGARALVASVWDDGGAIGVLRTDSSSDFYLEVTAVNSPVFAANWTIPKASFPPATDIAIAIILPVAGFEVPEFIHPIGPAATYVLLDQEFGVLEIGGTSLIELPVTATANTPIMASVRIDAAEDSDAAAYSLLEQAELVKEGTFLLATALSTGAFLPIDQSPTLLDCEDDTSEDNDVADTAATLSLSTATDYVLADRDWFELESSDELLQVTAQPIDGAVPLVCFEGEGGEPGICGPATLMLDQAAVGHKFVVRVPGDFYTCSSYALKVTVPVAGCGIDGLEPNNGPLDDGLAYRLNADLGIELQLTLSDVDYLGFKLRADTAYRFEVQAAWTGAASTGAHLELLKASGQGIESIATGETAIDIAVGDLANGDYLLRVFHPSGDYSCQAYTIIGKSLDL